MPIKEKYPEGFPTKKETEKIKEAYDVIIKPLIAESPMVIDGIVAAPPTISTLVPIEVGDQVIKEGYIWKYSIKVNAGPQGFIPADITISNSMERNIERHTYFTVVISKNKDSCDFPATFRILKKIERLGEELAMTMGVIATVKDAFIHQKKVKVQGKVNESVDINQSFIFIDLEIIEITN